MQCILHSIISHSISIKWKLTRFGDESINLHRNSRGQCSIACRYQDSRHLHTLVKLSTQLSSKSIQGPAQTSKIQVSEVNLFQKHLSIVASTSNPQYDKRLFIELPVEYMKIFQAHNMLSTQIVFSFRTIYEHNVFSWCSELGIFMY